LYAASLVEATERVESGIPDNVLIRKFITDSKPVLRARWAEDCNKPTSFDDVVRRFAEYEQGVALHT
jgi:hypothetical protein